ncbi:MAG: T9SS type A sorting domain-containing protein [Hymenobacter sp.]|nr:MAG: T9SS type A sorting domain-containing protein [Hymenobacter sp.]
MAKLYSVLAGCLLSVLAIGSRPAAAQTKTSPPIIRCGTQQADALQQAELQRLIPGYKPAKSTNTGTPRYQRTAALTYTLPVVVHVINDGEAVGVGTNLSQAQVQSQIDVLNEDYRNLNADGNNQAVVPGVFQPLRGDAQVQFQLALRNPSGNAMAEPGIDRINRTAKGFAAGPYMEDYIDRTIKPQTYWNPEQYINIWVMNLGGGLLGYAQFPDNTANLGGLSPLGGLASTDGVVILYYAFGSRAKNPTGTYNAPVPPGQPVPANPYDRGRTLTHEIGHYLSLRHIWGDDDQDPDVCSQSDYVGDTPNQALWNGGCPAFPHVTCANGPSGDMFMNYMDYVNDACMALFSKGQVDRIQALMSAGTPRRANLVNSPALCATIVAATATNSGAACPGGTITLAATGPAGATYAWIGPNGFTSTAQNPVLANVTTATAGTYQVQVAVATGACPRTVSTAVVVNNPPAVPILAASTTTLCPGTSATLSASGLLPVGALPNENFNGTAPGWAVGNTGAPAAAWQYSSGYTYPGFGFTNYTLNGSRFVIANSDAGGVGSTTNTTLTSPAFSTVGYASLSVSFLQAFYPYAAVSAALVEASTDGGTTWAVVARYDYELGTSTPVTSTINLAAYLNQPRVRLRWHYVDAYGVYWAIDNVQFTATQPALTYAWTQVSGDGLPTPATTPTITVVPSQNSVYRLTVGYVGTGCTSTATVRVNAYPAPALVASNPAICPGASAVLSAPNVAAFLPAPTYTWALVSGDGLPASTTAPTLVVTPTQNSVYRLTASFAGGACTTTATVAVAVTQPVWNGLAGDGNWFNAGNWTGCVPTRTLDATIPAGLTTTYPTLISGGGTAEVRTLTQPGALTMTGGELDLYGSHLGTGPLVLLNGTVATRGTGAQSLRAAAYATLLVGGTGPKTIGAATVTTALTLAGAILNTGPATVTLAPAATITETDASYVLGQVQTTHLVGTTPDTFGGLGLGLTAAVAPGTTTVVRTTGQPQGTGTASSIGRYYDITAALGQSLQGATLTQAYLPHELNGLLATQLVMFKSTNGGTTWTNEGATQRDANQVSRNFVTNVQGRWTLASATAPLAPATVAYSIVALPIPFTAEGLSLRVTTPTTGPLHVQLYDILGRAIYNYDVANVETGTSTVRLPGSGQLQPGKYILVVRQGSQEVRTNVVHGQ